MSLQRRPPPKVEPQAAVVEPRLPPHEIIVESKTGRVRQAGADDEGREIVEFRLECERSLYAFAKGILRRDLLSPRLHGWFCASLQRNPPYRKLRLMPRGHLKSTIVSEALPIHMLIQPDPENGENVYWPGISGADMRILLSGEKQDLMSAHLRWIENQWETNSLLRGLWPQRAWQIPRRDAKKWNENEMLIPRQNDYADPSIRVIGVGGAITGAHPNVLIKDDLISIEAANSPTVMQTAIEWHKSSRALLAPDEERGLEYIIGCLTADSQVTMADGTKRAICDVRVGDSVWSPSDDGSFTPRQVSRVIPQGFSDVLTVETTTASLRATPHHPFLISHGKNTLKWVQAQHLQVGDLVVSQKSIPSGQRTYDAEFLWLFGFLFGDGWVNNRPRKGYICFSPGVDAAQNEKVLSLLRQYVSQNQWVLEGGGYYRCDSVSGAALLTQLGLCAGAKKKRIPEWVYQEHHDGRFAFLRGFIAADGTHVSHQSYRVEISSHDLLEDLRHLARLCGVRPGRLRQRVRTIQAPHSPSPITATMYDCSFNFATIDRHETFNRNASGGINVGRDTVMDSGLRFDRVCRVTENAVQEAVWDLTVVGNPAFIANGLAVHNTRWAVSDLYSHIMQTDPSVECMTRSIVEDGVPIWPEKISLKHVADLRKEYGSLFHLLYMNNAGDPELTDFSETDLRYYTIQGDNLVFDENEMDLLLHDKEKAPARPSPDGLRGMPLTGDVYEMEFSAREEYLRFRMRP